MSTLYKYSEANTMKEYIQHERCIWSPNDTTFQGSFFVTDTSTRALSKIRPNKHACATNQFSKSLPVLVL